MDFIANFFELWGIAYLGPFSQYMYKADLYLIPFLWLVILPFIVLLFYYKFWDNIRWAKRGVWFAVVLVVSFVVAAVGFNTADEGLYDYLNAHHVTNSKIDDMSYIWFSLICFGWTLVWSFLLSLFLKKISVKARHIPF